MKPITWRHPPTRPLAAAMAAGLIVIAASIPGDSYSRIFAELAAAVAVGGWLIRLIGWSTLPRPRPGPTGAWLIVPSMVLIVALVVASHLPLRFRFALARDSMDTVRNVIAAERPGSCDAIMASGISTYQMSGYSHRGQSVFFHTGPSSSPTQALPTCPTGSMEWQVILGRWSGVRWPAI